MLIVRGRLALLQALLKEGDDGLLPTVMEAYARPTRIVRGKDVALDWMVDEGRFEMDEEHALWAAFQSTRKAVHPAMGIRQFLEASNFLKSHYTMARGHKECTQQFCSVTETNKPAAVHCITS